MADTADKQVPKKGNRRNPLVSDNEVSSKTQDGSNFPDAQGVYARSFSGFNLIEILVLEVFAGTARLTRSVRDACMGAMAIDKDKSRAQSVHVAQYDLNEQDQLDALCDFIQRHKDRILWAHFAPSCGTASRARGRPLPKLERMGIKIPKPLRSDNQPGGLDGLSGVDKIRAETANITYDSTCTLIKLCHSLAIALSLENPENSMFWEIPVVKGLLQEIVGYMTYFDNCCHGGTRKTGTAWRASVNWFDSLAVRCDGGHFHQKWNAEIVNGRVVFPTHLEAAYPVLLCERLAGIAKRKALEMGAAELATLEQQTQHAPSSQHRFLLDMLPKGRKFRPLVSEFGHYEKWAGFTLHGWMTESDAFPRETKRPGYTLEMVKNLAQGTSRMIWGQVSATADDDLARATWASTLEEIEKQWVWRDVSSDVENVVLAKRFGLQQKAKVRVIDDCPIGGYNRSYGTKEKLRVHAIDQLAAYLSWLCTRW